MRIKLDRTVCDGFGVCGLHAPETFSVDEWGYASLVDPRGEIAPRLEHDVRQALLDCPVHAITEFEGVPERSATTRPTNPVDHS